MADEKKSTAAGFLGSVLKYSVATYLGFGISGLALVISGILGPDVTALPLTFMTATATVMNLGILGLDQSLLRFYREPPEGHTGRELFGVCVSFSCGFLVLLGLICSLLCPAWLAKLLSFQALGTRIVPVLFLNSIFYMLVRYLNVLLRLEGNIRLYTVETLLMQACFNLIYLFAGLFTHDPYAFAGLAVVSFGMVALFFGRLCKEAFLPRRSAFSRPVLLCMVPYGLALAPTQILLNLNNTFSLAYIGNMVGTTAQGVFAFGVRLAQLVTAIQAGFSTFWGPYVYANYRTQQELIGRVHDYLNLLIFCFYCCLVAFENIIFWIFPAYRACQPIFPVLMLNVVFTILCEGTVYGISIARRPIFDTIGIGISAVGNIGLCMLLVPRLELLGAALALALSGGGMFLFRTVIAQYYYATIPSKQRTITAFMLCFLVAAAGVAFADRFFLKGLLCLAAILIYLSLYRSEVNDGVRFLLGWLRQFAAGRQK